MASGEAEAVPEPLQSKTVVLKVSIHCPGCKKKVQRVVKSINGVSTCEVDATHNKVTVTGNVDADFLIKKLLKSGKQAELWPEPKKQKPPTAAAAPQNPSPNPNPNTNTTPKKEPAAPKETSEKSDKKPSETPKEIAAAETKAAKEPPKPNEEPKKSTEEDDPKPDKHKSENPSEAPPTQSPAKEESSSSAGANKKEKKGQNDKSAGKRAADSAAPASPDAHAHQMHPMYLPPQPPAYAVSYNTVQPSTSHAYYAAAPVPHTSQGYGYVYSPYYPAPLQQPQPQQPPPMPMPMQLPLEDLYYGPPGSRPSSPHKDQYAYSVFDDENANSCSVM